MESIPYIEIWFGAFLVFLGALGTHSWLKRTPDPRHRRIVVRMIIALWLAAVVMIAGVFAIPRPFGFLLWGPCVLVMWPLLYGWHRQRERIREHDLRVLALGQTPDRRSGRGPS
jgi:hypothetical protein